MASEPIPGIDPQAVSDKEAKTFDSTPSSIPNVPKTDTPTNGFTVNEPPIGPPEPPKSQEPTVPAQASTPLIEPKFFEDADEDTTQDKEAKTDGGEEGELAELTNPGPEHFKRLRTSHSELKKTAADLKKERDELSAKLNKYDTGEIVPEVLKQKDEEITRLSKYEKLVNLKASKEYQEKFVTPIQATTAKLKEMFAEYGVPPEELDNAVNRAINTGNMVDLNRFLQEHFGNDQLGAIEAKTLVLKTKEIQQQAAEAEKEPAQMLESLQKESEAVLQVKEQNRKNKIVTSAKSSWVESLEEIREEGKLVELIHKEDDPEFNKFYPDVLIPEAAKEYGKLVTELGRLGAEDLPKPLAKALAKMVLMSYCSGVSADTRNRAIEGFDELSKNLPRQHTMMRPPIGGGVPRGANGNPMPAKIATPEQEARNILNGVLAKK